MKPVHKVEVTHPTKEQIREFMEHQRDIQTRARSIEEARRELGWHLIHNPDKMY